MKNRKALGIMQPYFLPYIGYFQLIAAVDEFVIYDKIKYTKKGWVNRNRFLLNGAPAFFTLPLKKASDHADVVERQISETFDTEKLLGKFKEAYKKAPHFDEVCPVLEQVIRYPQPNLFGYIRHALLLICEYISIDTPILTSSTLSHDNSLRAQKKVISICNAVGATTYINPIGGRELYKKADFAEEGIELRFLESQAFEYPQFGGNFVPSLSVIDVLMFNSQDEVKQAVLSNYRIV